ncbi:ABC transporter ATPase [Ursidibacter maritimus]|uniref:ABC transporter ATPase n=1 Tax=Ursidibacter maritimus TaxID=1331689 RepID=UPI001C450E47|nr:ABC transporter ATPase [Ursidibacter maritimus]
MKTYLKIAVLALSLSACSLPNKRFSLPDSVMFKGVEYQQVTHNQLDEMQQSLYLPVNSSKNPDDWQKGFLFFLDKNPQQRTLQQRLALREKSFANQANTQANLAITQDELRTEVIYPPTERFQNQQLEVSRGRDSQCGFSQMQFSDKRAVSAKNLQADLAELAIAFSKLPWLVECK